jgi:hypothetical protein
MIEMKLKKNYKYQFKINQILKDKSDLKKKTQLKEEKLEDGFF